MEQAVYDRRMASSSRNFHGLCAARAADGPSFVFETHNVLHNQSVGVKGAGEPRDRSHVRLWSTRSLRVMARIQNDHIEYARNADGCGLRSVSIRPAQSDRDNLGKNLRRGVGKAMTILECF